MSKVINKQLENEKKQIEEIFDAQDIQLEDTLNTSVRSYFFYHIEEKNFSRDHYFIMKPKIIKNGWRYIGKFNEAELFCNRNNTLLEIIFPPKVNDLKKGRIATQVKGDWGVTLVSRVGGYEECKVNSLKN